MRLLPQIALCLAVLPACKTDPSDPGDESLGPVAEDQFAATAAETLCAQLFACECGDNLGTTSTEPLPWADEAECVAEKQPEYQALLDAALESGGEYSPECGGQFISDFTRTDCQSEWDFFVGGGRYDYNAMLCPLVVREREVGESCTTDLGLTNDCGEGKLCTYENYTCVEVGDLPRGLGESCEIPFASNLPCAAGLFCRYDGETNVCQAAAELGDPCPNYECYGADLSCDYETLTCKPNAAEGESCEQTSCAAGLYCDGGLEFTCVAQYEFGSGCANDSVCANGGECIDNICTPPGPAVCGDL